MPSLQKVLQFVAVAFAILVTGLYLYAIWQIRESNPSGFFILLGGGLTGAFFLLRRVTAGKRQRRAVMKEDFPKEWRKFLEERVDFFIRLSEQERRRFEKEIQLFLNQKQITGIGIEIDDEVRLLVGASAIIPIFGFPGWEYRNLSEVLIYPGNFNDDFAQTGEGRDVLGMVGSGPMNRMMILSKPALINGFLRQNDGHNTGIHEFIHLIDASDGDYDGIPAKLLTHRYAEPWVDLIHQEIKQIKRGKSGLRAYGATNREEFFAVAGEYFFEKPGKLKKDNPELYEMLERIFRQNA